MRISAMANLNPQLPQTPPVKTVKVSIRGRVQGVGFRDWTMRNARDLLLDGWVRNRRDGSVEAVFSGDPHRVDEMVDTRCRVGPPAASVTGLSSSPFDDPPPPGAGFHCRSTA